MDEMYETGIGLATYVTVEVFKDDRKIKLTVDPVGRFNPGGCLAAVFVKKEQILALQSTEELYEYLLRKIFFENLEGVFDEELPDYTVNTVLEYTSKLQEDEENSRWLGYFQSLAKKTEEFHQELLALAEDVKQLDRVAVHEYHASMGEECDFVDYTCCPEGDDDDEIREWMEENLTSDSDIDAIMDCFEDGYFYGHSFKGEEVAEIDFRNDTFRKSMTISDIE
ncbi:MAG: hypothetical protein K6A14_00080 [Erysipelotrichaceae bacterium]|nr:hypothetical protein [Erysipelotrichaceae bacterium]